MFSAGQSETLADIDMESQYLRNVRIVVISPKEDSCDNSCRAQHLV